MKEKTAQSLEFKADTDQQQMRTPVRPFPPLRAMHQALIRVDDYLLLSARLMWNFGCEPANYICRNSTHRQWTAAMFEGSASSQRDRLPLTAQCSDIKTKSI